MRRVTRIAIVVAAAILAHAPAARCFAQADASLHGTVRDKDTNEPIAFVTVTLDSSVVRLSTSDGYFSFGSVPAGRHVLAFHHIAYKERLLTVEWPAARRPLVVLLEPSQFTVEGIVVQGERPPPSLPAGTVTVTREAATDAPGNIASDPLRTVQSQPSCASDGVDFLSKTAVRGGDTEEHRVYFDGYPLVHYAHAGGFTGVVYDDMLESTALIPGATPLQYTGTLSGVILEEPVASDTTFGSFRYDVTSMAAGISHGVGSSVAVQLAAKSNYFNLPAYQELGVDSRSFRDALGRVILFPRTSLTATATILAATDTEVGDVFAGAGLERDVTSVLAGVDLSWRPAGWHISARPYHSTYDSHDALTFRQRERRHRLDDSRLRFSIERVAPDFGVTVTGEVGSIHHDGSGGALRDTPASASAQIRLLGGEAVAVVAGFGGSREPWTADFEPEAYGSLRLALGKAATLSAAFRRSHQTPFIFSQRRYFASIPVDAGDLVENYAGSWRDAPAVRMDQTSVEATVALPFRCAVVGNAFHRRYHHLLTWDWTDLTSVEAVRSDGDGHGYGYEVSLVRDDPGFLSVMAAVSSARVWKREGTLPEEKIGDFDRPFALQLGVSAKLTKEARLSLRWMDVDGRPYTLYRRQTTPPTPDQVNAVHLRRFQRLDAKILYTYVGDTYEAIVFLDVINCLNRLNISAMYAWESQPGTYSSGAYGGTRFFPIAGATVRW